MYIRKSIALGLGRGGRSKLLHLPLQPHLMSSFPPLFGPQLNGPAFRLWNMTHSFVPQGLYTYFLPSSLPKLLLTFALHLANFCKFSKVSSNCSSLGRLDRVSLLNPLLTPGQWVVECLPVCWKVSSLQLEPSFLLFSPLHPQWQAQ